MIGTRGDSEVGTMTGEGISGEIKNWIRTELWDQVPVNISIIDQDFKIVEANRSFHRTYGDWANRPRYAVYKDRSERCTSCAAAETFADGQVRFIEERGVERDGKRTHYLVRMVPLVRPDGSIPYIVEMSTDITAIKELEQEKLEAERLAAVGQTVAGLAHGIKNVLMGIEGGMYVVRSGLEKGDGERIVRGWQALEENFDRISTFVKEFLGFARGRTLQVEMVDPNLIARQVIELYRDTAQLAGIELRADLQADIAPAPMDAEGIHACLANVVSNALDACDISDKPRRTATLTTRDEDGTLVFEVADNGVGMDYEVKKRIFTNFFSTKGSDKGTGLGLLTTRKIVQEHGGSVSFESIEGEGSVFRLLFPRQRLPQPKTAAEADPTD